jgi:GPH family glycoside/pentoside/hexuronide:cation symporter
MTAATGQGPEEMSERPPVGLLTRVSYGFGAAAYGVKDNGFSYFLLLFYSQVIGVDARLVGLALSIALFVDAFADPIIGYWSDNLRSRWGRRHPFMYGAALPVAATYFLMWNPPRDWSELHLFWYLMVLAVGIRVLISFYEIPSTALSPELTDHYDERSSLQAFRSFFGWFVGNFMSVFMFLVLFPAFATESIPNGQFNREAYATYGIVASCLILLSILASAWGTHDRIPHLKSPPPKRPLTPLKIFAEIFETLSNRSFLALFVAAIFGAIAAGLAAALSFYFYTYFWGFSTQQSGMITFGVFGSAVLGSVLAPIVGRKIGKKAGAIWIGFLAFVGSPMPIVLRLFGLMPENGDPALFWIIFSTTMLDVALIVAFQILSAAMMGDLVEQSELKTGRRSEGIFYAANAFIRKVVGGIGLTAATTVLTLAGLKAGADPTKVSAETIWHLGAYYVPIILGLWISMLLVMCLYNLSRSDHEDNLRKLRETRSTA